MTEKPHPEIYPETQFYWDGAKAGQLLLNHCTSCDQSYFPPRPFCPSCGNRDVTVREASGKGRLYSYVISHLPAPGYEPPYIVAVVELEEGTRMLTNLLDCPVDPSAIEVDMPVEVTFENRGDVTVPQFRPQGGAA
ncbi:MAG: Zn-ribbon domain-containing OB-fold protein [Ascidiaceihabitans sp.]|uniref:Zn-ribbon domain-containing OB-fold protein n=1 Tax=Ascidiaceihabitans sp. TaxID=1872644 RepID=UPI003296ADD2